MKFGWINEKVAKSFDKWGLDEGMNKKNWECH